MIARITGILRAIEENRVLIDVNGFTYAVLISKWAAGEIQNEHKIGSDMTLHTYHYIEGSATIGNLIPRIVGFISEIDLQFFSIFITVQGLSVKKGLRALIVSTTEVARAIESNDEAALKRLPEIGGKTAKKIIMELNGKMSEFIAAGSIETHGGINIIRNYSEFQMEAIKVLMQLEYTRDDAELAIERIKRDSPDLETADSIIQEVFRTHR